MKGRVAVVGLYLGLTACGGGSAEISSPAPSLQKQLVADPPAVNFAPQPVGTASEPQVVRLTASAAPVTISSIAITGPFSYSSPSLPVQVASVPLEISLTFTPTAEGSTVPSQLTILSNALNSALQVSLTGQGVAPRLAAEPASLDFSQQTVGTSSAPQTVRVTNVGSAVAKLETISIAPDEFAIAGPATPFSLSPSGSVEYVVSFTPSAVGSFSGQVGFISDAAASPVTVTFTGLGLAEGAFLNVLPSAINFGSQTLGTTSSSRTISLTNLGSFPVSLTGLTLSPAPPFAVAGWPGVTTLLSGESLPLTATFTPAAEGPASGSLAVASDAPGSPHTVALAGEGVLTPTDAVIPTLYNTFVPPLKSQSYIDPAFGGNITRLSDGLLQFATAVHHEYSSMSPFNADSTRILLLTGKGSFFIVDRAGNVVVGPDQLSISGMNEPRWSRSDPRVIYFHKSNQFLRRNLSDGTTAILRTFSQYSAIDFCGGEGDISEDGDHMVVCGDKRFVQVYRISTNTVSPALDLAGAAYDWFDMTPDNHVIGHLGKGSDPQRLVLYDKNMNFTREVVPYVGHNDRGRDINGDEVIVIVASNDLSPAPGCEGNGVQKVRLSDSRKTCLLPLYWFESTHVSINNSGGHPWVLVSNTHTMGTAHPPDTLPWDWQEQWGKYYNELTLVKLDGSEVRRLAHHRSRRYNDYWYTPRAALSRDGKFALFDSTHALGAPLVPDYTDAYLLTIGP